MILNLAVLICLWDCIHLSSSSLALQTARNRISPLHARRKTALNGITAGAGTVSAFAKGVTSPP